MNIVKDSINNKWPEYIIFPIEASMYESLNKVYEMGINTFKKKNNLVSIKITMSGKDLYWPTKYLVVKIRDLNDLDVILKFLDFMEFQEYYELYGNIYCKMGTSYTVENEGRFLKVPDDKIKDMKKNANRYVYWGNNYYIFETMRR